MFIRGRPWLKNWTFFALYGIVDDAFYSGSDRAMKVFISSTYVDLIEYRRKAIEVVNRYKCIPLAMEHFGARTEDATTVCEKEIRECDIFIGIYAHRYGFIPKGEKKSITQLEYELAKELGKDCLCFIMDKDFPWPFSAIEMDKYAELNAFLEDVKKACVVESFKSPEDLGLKLAAPLSKLIGKQGQEEGVRLIPVRLILIWRTPMRCRNILPGGGRRWPCFPTGSLMKRNPCWCWKPSAAWAKALYPGPGSKKK
jgi:hypothetical protein